MTGWRWRRPGAVKELGLRIPEDILVIGYDDQEEIVRYIRPPLTTMRIPYYEMGEFAAAAVLDGQAPEWKRFAATL